MPLRLRRLSGREVAAALVQCGFEVVATRGSHCKLRRTLSSGERQTLTIPLHSVLATGTLHAIYRQACRFVPETELRSHFYSGAPEPGESEGRTQPQPGEIPKPRAAPQRPRPHRRKR
ncbi:MAG: type II toxin-antitoxin system HicA family toxin [Acidobacteria bacterium]|nr:type II toxin-antitoxin system HicA family toxin [Acidobacteriota bacterium]